MCPPRQISGALPWRAPRCVARAREAPRLAHQVETLRAALEAVRAGGARAAADARAAGEAERTALEAALEAARAESEERRVALEGAEVRAAAEAARAAHAVAAAGEAQEAREAQVLRRPGPPARAKGDLCSQSRWTPVRRGERRRGQGAERRRGLRRIAGRRQRS